MSKTPANLHAFAFCSILLWLWNSRLDSKEQDFDRNFSDLLCWFLLPEGHGDYVWDWIES